MLCIASPKPSFESLNVNPFGIDICGSSLKPKWPVVGRRLDRHAEPDKERNLWMDRGNRDNLKCVKFFCLSLRKTCTSLTQPCNISLVEVKHLGLFWRSKDTWSFESLLTNVWVGTRRVEIPHPERALRRTEVRLVEIVKKLDDLAAAVDVLARLRYESCTNQIPGELS